jgi:hypothetical protein
MTEALLTSRPALRSEIAQFFIPVTRPAPAGSTLVYQPMAIGVAQVAFSDPKISSVHARTLTVLANIDTKLGTADWTSSTTLAISPKDLDTQPQSQAVFGPLPPQAARTKAYEAWRKSFSQWLAQTQQLELWQSSQREVVSQPGERERDFRIRLQTLGRERRDTLVDQLRRRYAAKLAALDEKARRARQAVDREAAQASQQKVQTAVSVGATVLGALLGRKTFSTSTIGRATTAARSMSRTKKETEDIERAKETLAAVEQQRAELEAEIQREIAVLSAATDPLTETLVPLVLKPKRGGIAVQVIGLAWAPFVADSQGHLVPAWS